MFKIEQLFEANHQQIESKVNSKNYKQVLEKKFASLIQEQENEQLLLEESIEEHNQLKTLLAEQIRQQHVSGVSKRRKSTVKDQQKKYEYRQLLAQIEQLEQDLHERQSNQIREEVEKLGGRISELKVDADENKENLLASTHKVQELSSAYQSINQQLNLIKAHYNQLQQEIKAGQIRYNQLIASSTHYDQETEKLTKEIQRLGPKLGQKQQKMEELENLKLRLDQELAQKCSQLEEERQKLKYLEDDHARTNNFDKMIKVESKASDQLQTERKLLLDEFQRICAISGIDQISDGLQQESDIKLLQNKQTIDSQEKVMDQHEQDILAQSQMQDQLLNRRNELLTRYSGLEKQMDELSRKFAQLEKSS